MKEKLFNFWTKCLVAILGLLGFACGDKEDGDGGLVLLYGCPTATFKVSGTVTDQDSNPIANAQVVVAVIEGRTDTLKTSADGKFSVDKEDWPGIHLSIVTSCEGYSKDSVNFEPIYKGGDNSWYEGLCDTTYNPVLTKLPEPEKNQNTENNDEN